MQPTDRFPRGQVMPDQLIRRCCIDRLNWQRLSGPIRSPRGFFRRLEATNRSIVVTYLVAGANKETRRGRMTNVFNSLRTIRPAGPLAELPKRG
jgi:hypothetical protein